jgi:hypothetical protein
MAINNESEFLPISTHNSEPLGSINKNQNHKGFWVYPHLILLQTKKSR